MKQLSFFKNSEAIFYNDINDLVTQVKYYMSNNKSLETLTEKGNKDCSSPRERLQIYYSHLASTNFTLRKIALIHLLPLEYYPPVTNLLSIIDKDSSLSVRVFSTHNNKKRKAFNLRGTKIFRYTYPGYLQTLY